MGNVLKLNVGTTGESAPVLKPVVDDEGLKVVEISEAGSLEESDTQYVLIKDIVAPKDAISFADGVKNVVLDLNGHTLTFDEGPPEKAYGTTDLRQGRSACGIRASGKVSHIVIRNGVVLQGKGESAYSCGIRIGGSHVEICEVTVKVYGVMCYNIYAKWGGDYHRIHDNYLENHSLEKAGGVNIGTSGICISQAGNHWDIYNNTVVGGHRGIEVWMCGPGKGKTTQGHPLKIHHNFLSPRRIHGYKSPHGILSYRCEGVAIYENEVQSWDSRGINTQGNHNLVHHNFIDCRYSTNARTSKKGGYIENRCYGFWERGCYKNKVHHNVIIVHNEVEGDGASSSMGIHASVYGTGENGVHFGEYLHNRIIVSHKDKNVPVLGIYTKKAGGNEATGTGDCLIAQNEILAGTAAIEVNYPTRGAVVKDNLCVDSGREGWRMLSGGCIQQSKTENNRQIEKPAGGRPAVPRSLKAVKRPGAVELRWERNAEKDVLGYNIYRDGKQINPFLNGARFAVDLEVDSGREYTYSITAVNLADKESEPSQAVTIRP